MVSWSHGGVWVCFVTGRLSNSSPIINYTLPAPAALIGTFSAACGISLSYSNLSVCPPPTPEQATLTLNGLKYDWVVANEAAVKVRQRKLRNLCTWRSQRMTGIAGRSSAFHRYQCETSRGCSVCCFIHKHWRWCCVHVCLCGELACCLRVFAIMISRRPSQADTPSRTTIIGAAIQNSAMLNTLNLTDVLSVGG